MTESATTNDRFQHSLQIDSIQMAVLREVTEAAIEEMDLGHNRVFGADYDWPMDELTATEHANDSLYEMPPSGGTLAITDEAEAVAFVHACIWGRDVEYNDRFAEGSDEKMLRAKQMVCESILSDLPETLIPSHV